MHERLAAARTSRAGSAASSCGRSNEHGARVIVGTWASREDWASWHDAEAFRETRQRLEGLQAGRAR
jgi:heme-degrading monooxygenase HmoA